MHVLIVTCVTTHYEIWPKAQAYTVCFNYNNHAKATKCVCYNKRSSSRMYLHIFINFSCSDEVATSVHGISMF